MINHDYRTTIDDKITLLKSRYNELNKQIADLSFYRKCCIEKFVEEANGYCSMELPYSIQFYDSLMNEKNENHKRNKKFLQDDIRRLLVKDAEITSFTWNGYDMHEFTVEFTSDKQHYELVIPMSSNITLYNASSLDCDYVDWDIIQFRLLVKTSTSCWKTVWSGYRLADCNYFAENNVEDLPFK